mmetsp:Transcript_3796/g.14087  ORF Transcript_3796/g.14087 Transcript_3796/m.14087 type:complete len:568 (-) Transcript_3796:109-1812(-)
MSPSSRCRLASSLMTARPPKSAAELPRASKPARRTSPPSPMPTAAPISAALRVNVMPVPSKADSCTNSAPPHTESSSQRRCSASTWAPDSNAPRGRDSCPVLADDAALPTNSTSVATTAESSMTATAPPAQPSLASDVPVHALSSKRTRVSVACASSSMNTAPPRSPAWEPEMPTSVSVRLHFSQWMVPPSSPADAPVNELDVTSTMPPKTCIEPASSPARAPSKLQSENDTEKIGATALEPLAAVTSTSPPSDAASLPSNAARSKVASESWMATPPPRAPVLPTTSMSADAIAEPPASCSPPPVVSATFPTTRTSWSMTSLEWKNAPPPTDAWLSSSCRSAAVSNTPVAAYRPPPTMAAERSSVTPLRSTDAPPVAAIAPPTSDATQSVNTTSVAASAAEKPLTATPAPHDERQPAMLTPSSSSAPETRNARASAPPQSTVVKLDPAPSTRTVLPASTTWSTPAYEPACRRSVTSPPAPAARAAAIDGKGRAALPSGAASASTPRGLTFSSSPTATPEPTTHKHAMRTIWRRRSGAGRHLARPMPPDGAASDGAISVSAGSVLRLP